MLLYEQETAREALTALISLHLYLKPCELSSQTFCLRLTHPCRTGMLLICMLVLTLKTDVLNQMLDFTRLLSKEGLVSAFVLYPYGDCF